MSNAFSYDDTVLVEKFIPPGREIRFGVYEDESGEMVALPGIEYFLSDKSPIRLPEDKLTTDEKGMPCKFAPVNK